MKYFTLAGQTASRVAQGCMRLSALSPQALDALVRTDLDCGINFFDHADIYGGGECERLFGDVLRADPSLRARMLIQTKCGIRKGCYDFSRQHIMEAAEGSLRRLGVEQVDFLLLHRPDTLMEPDEVAEAFTRLHGQGKVRFFGVSNHNPAQMALLGSALGEHPIVIDQLQFSLTNTTMIDAGLNVNMENAGAVNRDGSVLEYCRLHGITIQPWSPFQYGFFEGTFLGSERYAPLNEKLAQIAARHGITPTGLAIAWILRHPAVMQPIVGSTRPDRMQEIARAADVTLSREEWYELYLSTGKTLP